MTDRKMAGTNVHVLETSVPPDKRLIRKMAGTDFHVLETYVPPDKKTEV